MVMNLIVIFSSGLLMNVSYYYYFFRLNEQQRLDFRLEVLQALKKVRDGTKTQKPISSQAMKGRQ